MSEAGTQASAVTGKRAVRGYKIVVLGDGGVGKSGECTRQGRGEGFREGAQVLVGSLAHSANPDTELRSRAAEGFSPRPL